MTDSLEDALEGAVTQYVQGSRLVLLFDYDGTLTEFADRPSHATLPPATRCALATLAVQPRVSVGIISGRELDDLKQMVGLPGLFYAGTSGLECDLRGEISTHPLAQQAVQPLTEFVEAFQPSLRDFPGTWLERKRFGLTIHFRELDAALEPLFHSCLQQALTAWSCELHVVTGAKSVEIIPNLGWTKGAAVELFLQRLGPIPRLVIYAGDEASDVEVLWEVGIHKGITIGVGQSAPSSAQYELPDSEAVERLLEQLCEALGSIGSLP